MYNVQHYNVLTERSLDQISQP